MSFIKWAGKKEKLWAQYQPYFPKKTEFRDYYEPFLGSGSIFFQLELDQYNTAFLSDVNLELVTTFSMIQYKLKLLITELEELQKRQKMVGHEVFYYFMRQNRHLVFDYKIAARFLYLNYCGFNGLYRVNSKGNFNVPIGKNSQGFFYDFKPNFDQLRDCSYKLNQTITITSGVGYNVALQSPKSGDFVYLDPPYYSESAAFTKYSAKDFDDYDHRNLALILDRLSAKGVKWALSNSDTEWVRERYEDYKIIEISRSGCMNSDVSKRQTVPELLVLNY